jgi:curved DNA-binding protein CbpA
VVVQCACASEGSLRGCNESSAFFFLLLLSRNILVRANKHLQMLARAAAWAWGASLGARGVVRPHLLQWSLVDSGRGFSSKTFSGSFSDTKCAYDVLSVPPSATGAEIKTAFRQTARSLHPDAAPATKKDSNTDLFVKAVAAYEILGCAKTRALYDAERSANDRWGKWTNGKTSRGKTNTADSSNASPWEFVLRHSEVLKEYTSSIDALVPKNVLRRELYAALGEVLFGPELDTEAVANGDAFPKFFEAEERSSSANVANDKSRAGLRTAGIDLMHIVSGRTLLGAVRERMDAALPSQERPENFETFFPVAETSEGAATGLAPNTNVSQTPSTAPRYTKTVNSSNNTHPPFDAVLELVIRGRVVATAVRQTRNGDVVVYDAGYARNGNAQKTEASLRAANQNNFAGFGGMLTDAKRVSFHETGCGYDDDPSTRIIDPFKHRGQHGEIMQISGLSGSFDSATIKNSNGTTTHWVTAAATPGVTHLHWFCENTKKVVGKATRAWLPPPGFWALPPRSTEHAHGGWYFELGRLDVNDKRQGALPKIETDANELFKTRDAFQEVADDITAAKKFFKGGKDTNREEKQVPPVPLPPAAAVFTTGFRLLDRERGEKHGVKGAVERAWASVFGGRY